MYWLINSIYLIQESSKQFRASKRTCDVAVHLELVPDDVDGGQQEEEPTHHLDGVVDEQGVLHAVIVHGEVATSLVRLSNEAVKLVLGCVGAGVLLRDGPSQRVGDLNN